MTPARRAERHAPGRERIDARTTRHVGYAKSQRPRPRIERAFGRLKTIAGVRKAKLRGLAKVDAHLMFAGAAFNIKRIVTMRARLAQNALTAKGRIDSASLTTIRFVARTSPIGILTKNDGMINRISATS